MTCARVVSGAGPDLVLVHGWGMNAAAWGVLPALLESRFRVTRLELPGHGESGWNGEGSDPTRWARALLAAAPPRATWVGWSLGGLVALQATALAPERIVALVGVASTPCFVQRPDWRPAMAEETLAGFGDRLLNDLDGTIQQFLALQFHGVKEARALMRRLRQDLARRPPPRPQALQAGLALLRDCDLRLRLAAVDRPRLWILGGRDRLVPPALADALPEGVRVHFVEEAGHAPFLSHPEAVASTLTAFSTHG